MFLGQLHVRRTATSGHERLSFFQFLDQFFRLMTGGFHSALRHLDHFLESQGLDSAIHFFLRSAKLS